MTPSLEARLFSRLRQSGDCWLWTGSGDGKGYGQMSVSGRIRGVHRVAYELLRSEIPDGLELDHLCRNRGCCNPWHLEPVTHAENLRRSWRDTRSLDLQSECSRGHALTPENIARSARGAKRCRECLNRKKREQRARRRARMNRPQE